MNKKLLVSLLLALAAAGVTLLVVWLSSLLSWWLVFVIVYTIMVFPAYTVVTIWDEEQCYDLEDFWDALTSRQKKLSDKKDEKTASSNSIFDTDDYRKYP